MAKAYTVTSDPFYINGNVTESAASTFTQVQISAPLDSLNREGLIVHGVYFTSNQPDRVPATETALNMQVTSTSKTAIVNANDANLLSRRELLTTGGAAEFSGPHKIDFVGSESAYTMDDVLGIVATDDLFLGIAGFNNVNAKSAQVRIVCSRIKLSADAYAALVTNELSS
jgi:hypothetical protein